MLPRLSGAEVSGGRRAFWVRSSHYLGAALSLGALALAAMAALAPLLAVWIAGEASPETMRAAAVLSRALSPVAFVVMVGSTAAAILSARGLQLWASTAELAGGLLVIPFILLFAGTWGIEAVAWGWSWGNLLFLSLLLAPLAGHAPFWRRVVSTAAVGKVPELLRGCAPITGFILMSQAVTLVERRLGAGLGEGALAVLSYAYKFTFLPLGILAGAIVAGTLPELSKDFHAGRLDGVRGIVRRQVVSFAAWSVPLACVLAYEARIWVDVALRRGHFDASAAQRTAACLTAYAPCVVLYGAGILFIRGLQVQGRWRLLGLATAASVAGTIALDVFLAPRLGEVGLALGFSIGQALFLAVAGWGTLRHIGLRLQDLKDLLPIGALSAVGCAILGLGPSAGPAGAILRLAGFTAVVLLGYAATGILRRGTFLRTSAEASG